MIMSQIPKLVRRSQITGSEPEEEGREGRLIKNANFSVDSFRGPANAQQSRRESRLKRITASRSIIGLKSQFGDRQTARNLKKCSISDPRIAARIIINQATILIEISGSLSLVDSTRMENVLVRSFVLLLANMDRRPPTPLGHD